jgi:hypothetical protein
MIGFMSCHCIFRERVPSKIKVKFTVEQAQRRSRGTDPLFL